jgi:hypothetical protein
MKIQVDRWNSLLSIIVLIVFTTTSCAAKTSEVVSNNQGSGQTVSESTVQIIPYVNETKFEPEAFPPDAGIIDQLSWSPGAGGGSPCPGQFDIQGAEGITQVPFYPVFFIFSGLKDGSTGQLTLPDGSTELFNLSKSEGDTWDSEDGNGYYCKRINYDVRPGTQLGSYKLEVTSDSKSVETSFVLEIVDHPVKDFLDDNALWLVGFKPNELMDIYYYEHDPENPSSYLLTASIIGYQQVEADEHGMALISFASSGKSPKDFWYRIFGQSGSIIKDLSE